MSKPEIQTYIDYVKEEILKIDPQFPLDSEYDVSEFLGNGYVWINGTSVYVPEFEALYQHGGEGEGDHAEWVFKVKDKLFAMYAYYASYDGYTFDDVWDWHEVRPVQVTRYEAI